MTDRITLRDEAKRLNTPPLQGRGRGWGVNAERLDQLNGFARDMRNNPTEPEKRLWRALSNRQLGAKFRRQAVIPPYIADFMCPALKLIVEVDGDTHDAPVDARRDAHLAQLGYRVVRVTNADVMTNIDGVLAFILETLSDSPRPHPNPSPEGEGLGAVEAQKLLGHQPREECGMTPATTTTVIWIAVALWFATGWYLNMQLAKIHRKLDVVFDQFDGLRRYLYEIDPQFDYERKLTQGLFESVDGGKASFDGMHLNDLLREKRERGERTLNTGFGSDQNF